LETTIKEFLKPEFPPLPFSPNYTKSKPKKSPFFRENAVRDFPDDLAAKRD
jgi:hypothetical protein